MKFKTAIAVGYILSNLILSPAAAAEDKLIFAVDLIRHGDRNPIDSLPASPYQWVGGLGQLTPLGMQQEYQLGVQLRKKYIEETHLLPANYQVETLYVRSTNVDRTLMSAESLLYGLYPLGTGAQTLPSAFQPIPIHTILREQDVSLIPEENKNKFDALVFLHVMMTGEWHQKTIELKPKFQQWSQLTGRPVNHLYDLLSIGDNLHIRELHHIPLPKGMNVETANEIIDAAKWTFVHIYRPYQVGIGTAKPFIKHVQDYFQQASAQKTPLKLVLFSAHDSTILSVLSALRAPIDYQPPYASDLNFSLIENANQYFVKITFNGKPVVIPACKSDTCTLQAFLAL